MALRPIFCPMLDGDIGVVEKMMDFKWHPGVSVSQKQKSINELHTVAKTHGLDDVLEVSSKSLDELGVALSAFNLCITTKVKQQRFTVETAFQGSKVFENGGPYRDLFGLDSLAAKKDERTKSSGNLTHFEFFGTVFPNTPRTYFYDWLYINALVQNDDLAKRVIKYQAFSDIEFNPKKSINCQAYSVALYVSLMHHNLLDKALSSPESFLSLTEAQYNHQLRAKPVQQKMF
ncbi:hypothetical protein R7P67_22475 [Vibrio sp. Vb0937]|uniref:DarT1-associated NADAR antitoxin family protein n=1 Tax=unclassified Vibrio TaxID=2614977 RepID=UPI0021CE22C9|nr:MULTISPECIES: hypothetical protein [unclassified Vibrio]MDW1827804.1 hypothetical protein [Vibrio sp. Vb0937]MDW3189012.1 hypothetical protein [Vibrio sp. Vb0932]